MSFFPSRAHRPRIPQWTLTCPDCKKDFAHSNIAEDIKTWRLDPFAELLDKPVFPEAGASFECPNCKKNSVYHRYQLCYAAA
jgi:ribosomal protein L37AE/L43A